MGTRLAHAAAAAGALALAAVCLRTYRAETAYGAGLALAERADASPGEDVPGRLEAYEEASRIDPGEGLYRLRTGQIRLQRAKRAPGVPDDAELAAAAAALDAAARTRPLDVRVHCGRVQLARARRDLDGALRAVSAARAAAPISPAALLAASATQTWAWRVTGDASHLRDALAAARDLDAIGEATAARELAADLRNSGHELAGDLAEAAAGDIGLLRFAARIVAPARPEVARVLAPPVPQPGGD